MNNKKIQIFPSDLMMETIDRLPKGTKAKFINLCVEHCLLNPDVKKQLLLELLGFGEESGTKETTTVNTENSTITDGSKISSSMIKFNSK